MDKLIRMVSITLLTLSLFIPALKAQSLSLQELVNRKQYPEVLARVDSLTAADSASYSTMSAIGQAYEGMFRYKDAYKCFQYCLSMDTTNVDALNALARAAINYGKIAEAKHCYGKVLEADSLNFYANNQLARLHYQLGDYDKAIDYYHTLSSYESDNPTILAGLADCHMKKGGVNLLIALELYSRAMEINPENIRVASSLINSLLWKGDGKGALQVCDTALYYNPDNRQIRQSQGMALYLTRNYQKADTVYTSLLAEGDSSFINLKYAGASRFMAGHTLDAVEPLEMAYDIDSTDVETLILYGAALGKTYDRQRAYLLFDQAEECMKPKQFYVNLLATYRGNTLWRDGRHAEAERVYYEAWKKDPTQLNFLYEINKHYWIKDTELFKDEKKLQKLLFIHYTYTTELMKKKENESNLYSHRYFLEDLYKEAFFRNLTELTMLAPDGKKSKLSMDDLQKLISQLPDPPESEKKRREQMKAAMKKYEEQEKKGKNKGRIARDSVREVKIEAKSVQL